VDISKTESVKKFTKSLAAPPGVCIPSARSERIHFHSVLFFVGQAAGF
jgi:hypothetical protein